MKFIRNDVCFYDGVSFFRPIGSIVGAVIGSLVGLACLVGLIVFFCYIRPRRLAAAGHVIHTPGNNVAVVSTTGWFQTLHLILLLAKFYFQRQIIFFFLKIRQHHALLFVPLSETDNEKAPYHSIGGRIKRQTTACEALSGESRAKFSKTMV